MKITKYTFAMIVLFNALIVVTGCPFLLTLSATFTLVILLSSKLKA